jgi:CDP-paratose synthetase
MVTAPHILLTGATGYLGSHLLRVLTASSYGVTILKRSTSDTRRIANLIPCVTSMDIDRIDIDKAFTKDHAVDAIIHAAATYGRKGESLSAVHDANVSFGLRLLEAARGKVRVFLYLDTALPRTHNAYALSKKQLADWGTWLDAAGAFRFVDVQIEHFFGPWDTADRFPTYIIRNCAAHVPRLDLTPGEQKRDFIYVTDVVSALLRLLAATLKEEELVPAVPLGSGNAVTVRSFVETVHRLTRSRTQLCFGALAYRPGETMFSAADTSFLRRLGWAPNVTIEEGILNILREERLP